MNALLLLLCPLCTSGRGQGGWALLVIAGMIAVPYLVVLLVARAIREEDLR